MSQLGTGFHNATGGTFDGTGTSAVVTGRRVSGILSFAGTATVALQVKTSGGTWVGVTDNAGTAVSFDDSGTFDYEFATDRDWRLNCSAHTNDVVYEIIAT